MHFASWSACVMCALEAKRREAMMTGAGGGGYEDAHAQHERVLQLHEQRRRAQMENADGQCAALSLRVAWHECNVLLRVQRLWLS